MNVIISKEIPVVYERLKNKFGVTWEKGLIIAFDGKIHCKDDVQPQKIIHEQVHLKEQDKIGNDAWWELYFTNDQFRLEEEVKAYKAEASFIKKYIKNREDRFHMINDIADNFSSSIYGNIVTKDETLKLLL